MGRYLSLVADLPELRVKQEHLFALSATLAGPDPQTALVHLEELAKAAPQALEILDLQFKCYQQLGKAAEAAALRSKIEALRAPPRSQTTAQIETEAAAPVVKATENKEAVFSLAADGEQTKPRERKSENQAVAEKTPMRVGLAVNEKTMLNADAQKTLAESLFRSKSSGAEKTNLQNRPSQTLEEDAAPSKASEIEAARQISKASLPHQAQKPYR